MENSNIVKDHEQYINEVLKRVNMRDISNFFLYGYDGIPTIDRTALGEQLVKADRKIQDFIDRQSTDKTNVEELEEVSYHALRTYEQVFFETGLKAGIELVFKCLFNLNAKEVNR